MKRDAKRVGGQILAEEGALEAAFRAQTITPSALRTRVARIGALQGQLRTVHLQALLATRVLLTEDQVEECDRLRGYSARLLRTTNTSTGTRHSSNRRVVP